MIFGAPDGEWWRVATAPFAYDNTGYAFVVLFAIAKPDLSDRSDPPWLDEVCAQSDLCDHREP